MARIWRSVVTVVGDEDVISSVAVEVSDQNLPSPFAAGRWTGPYRCAVGEAAVAVGEEDADRMSYVRGWIRNPRRDDVREVVAVEAPRRDFCGSTDVRRDRHDRPRRAEDRR